MQARRRFSLWMFILSALILVIFSVQNANEVTFNFFIWKSHLSLSILLIVAFLMGIIVGAIFSFRGRPASKSKKTLDAARAKSEKEIASNETEDPDLENVQSTK